MLNEFFFRTIIIFFSIFDNIDFKRLFKKFFSFFMGWPNEILYLDFTVMYFNYLIELLRTNIIYFLKNVIYFLTNKFKQSR